MKDDIAKIKLKLHAAIDIEETKIRLWMSQDNMDWFKLQLLTCFRPNASLRQLNNQRKVTFK